MKEQEIYWECVRDKELWSAKNFTLGEKYLQTTEDGLYGTIELINNYGSHESLYPEEFNCFKKVEPPTPKSLLKTGMVVKMNTGELRLVWGKTLVGVGAAGGIDLNDTDKNIKCSYGFMDYAVEIYSEPNKHDGLAANIVFWLTEGNVLEHCTLLWSKDKPTTPEYTVEELVKIVGHNFKIKK